MLSGDVYTVDIVHDNNQNAWPNHLYGEKVVLVNISLKFVLDDYVSRLWPGLVVLNEVYPEPTPATVEKLASRGCSCYHVVGVSGRAVPYFPSAYQGGIPCCAAWLSEGIESLLLKLT